MKQFNVETYYRPDLSMAEMIAKHLYVVSKFQGHRFQMAMFAGPETLAFVQANPDSLVLNLSYEDLTGHYPPYGSGVPTDYVIIGVSLKMVTREIFKALTKKSSIFTIADIVDYKHSTITSTENPNIFIINDRYVWNEKAVSLVLTYTAAEEEWIKLWEGFDHYYGYSDDHSVWKRWDSRSKEIYAEGRTLGISMGRMEMIFKYRVQP